MWQTPMPLDIAFLAATLIERGDGAVPRTFRGRLQRYALHSKRRHSEPE